VIEGKRAVLNGGGKGPVFLYSEEELPRGTGRKEGDLLDYERGGMAGAEDTGLNDENLKREKNGPIF